MKPSHMLSEEAFSAIRARKQRARDASRPKDHNRWPRTPAKYRPRKYRITRSAAGELVLEGLAPEQAGPTRDVSAAAQVRFVETLNGVAQRWHNVDRCDPFAQGALAIAYFKGDAHTTLQLHSVPGILPWRVLKRERIGVTERLTQGLRGPRHRLSQLGGDCAPR